MKVLTVGTHNIMPHITINEVLAMRYVSTGHHLCDARGKCHALKLQLTNTVPEFARKYYSLI